MKRCAVPFKEAKQAKPPERKFLDTKSLNNFKNVMNCLFNVWRSRRRRSLLFWHIVSLKYQITLELKTRKAPKKKRVSVLKTHFISHKDTDSICPAIPAEWLMIIPFFQPIKTTTTTRDALYKSTISSSTKWLMRLSSLSHLNALTEFHEWKICVWVKILHN